MTDPIDEAIARARSERAHGRLLEARDDYARAVALARSAGDDTALAFTLRHLGDVSLKTGALAAAAAAAEEAVSICRRLPGDLDLANALRIAALAAGQMGQPGDAADKWREARDLYARAGVADGVVECDAHIGAASATP